MSRGQRNVLPVRHVARLFSVSQAVAFTLSASRHYNMAIYGAQSLSVCVVNLRRVILSTPNSIPPLSFFIFLCLFVNTPHLFLSIFLSSTPLSLTTLRANLDPRVRL